jgi:hypothetical protein
LFAWRVVESLGPSVTLPMKLDVDNKSVVDLANSWTATNRTRHIATRIIFLRELKAQSTVSVQWLSNCLMSSDIFTKNVVGSDFNRHRDVYVRDNPSTPCTQSHATALLMSAGEGVGVVRAVTRNDRTNLGVKGAFGFRKRKWSGLCS